MDARSLLRAQVTGAHGLLTETVAGISPEEWTARAYPGANLLGFTAWHVPAVQDWALHTWMRGQSELRERPELASLPGLNPPFAAFGISLADADAIAAALSPRAVVSYADAMLEALTAALDAMVDGDLDVVGDTRAWGTQLPQHRTPGYLAEVDDMYDFPAWRLFAGPCFGHVRAHVGEIDVCLDILRAR